jgi:hypothetical protein
MKQNTLFISLSEKLRDIKEYDYVKNREVDSLQNIATQVTSSDNIIEGSPSDFYDFAVDLAKLNQNKTACDVLRRGIAYNKGSVDLLAIYLVFGKDIEELQDNLKECYETLKNIPNESWTWRCYSFSLDYLESKRSRTIDKYEISSINNEMEHLVKAYYEKDPNNERPYFAEAKLYSGSKPKEEKRILEEAISKLDSCPECSIRYAELLFDSLSSMDPQGNNEKYRIAAENLKYAKLLQTNKDLDFGYSQYLRALCLIRLLSEDDYKNSEKIDEIYDCFRIAKDDELRLRGNYVHIMDKHIRMLEIKSKKYIE